MAQNEPPKNDTNYTLNSTEVNKNEINSLKEEINSIKEINEKTKDYLLLELQSKLEQYDYEQSKLLFESKEKLIEQISEENEYLKRNVSDKEEINQTLSEKYDDANKIIADNKNKINELNKKISEQNDEISANKENLALKNKAIDELHSEIDNLNNEKTEVTLENKTKTDEINRKNEAMADKDVLNSDLIFKLKEKDEIILNIQKNSEGEILKLNEIISQKDALNSDLTSRLKEKEETIITNKETTYEEINKLKEIITKKDNINNDLTSKLKEKENTLLNNQKTADWEINKLKGIITKKDDINNNLTSKLNKNEDTLHEKEQLINRLNSEINNRNKIVLDTKNKIEELSKNISMLEKSINENNDEISALKSKNNTLVNEKETLINTLNSKNDEIKKQEIVLNKNKKTIDELNLIKGRYMNQIAALDTNRYFMNNLKQDLETKDLEIRYLKSRNLVKKISGSFSYAYLILKSDPKEISLNLKLYNSLKNSDEFDVGYYLANYEDIRKSKWAKYFSPQLHYVCRGFDERREINKRHFKAESKKELLDYIHSVSAHKN